jgi:hypothetical protein
MIQTSAELDDETAETMESQIVTNQDMLAFFTNFDHWVDYVALSIWVLGLTSLLIGAVLFFRADKEESSASMWGNEPESTDFTQEVNTENDEVVGNIYNVQNITIQDSVVVDSNLANASDQEPEKSPDASQNED